MKETKVKMDAILNWLAPVAVLLVFIVLCFGLYNMLRGTNPNMSQKLMRWRVGLQFLAVIILMAAIYFAA